MPNFHIENSPSSAAGCKVCKEKIAKGVLRICSVSESTTNDMIFKSNYHVPCFNIPRTHEIQDPERWCEEVLRDETIERIMGTDKERARIVADIAAKPEKKKKVLAVMDDNGKDTAPPGASKLDKFKAVAALETSVKKSKKKTKQSKDEQEADEGPSAKKQKIKLTMEEEEEFAIYSMCKDMTNDALQDVLRWNLQLSTGTKPILLARVMDGQMRGRLARCPLCIHGKMAVRDADAKEASCTGYYDEDLSARVSCSYKESVKKVRRLLPWWSEKPTEEEEIAMKELDDTAKTGKAASSSDAIEAFAVKVKKLDWKTSNKAEIQKSTAAMIAILTKGEGSKVNLPKGRELMAVGKLVAANQTKSAQEILNMVVEQFGFVADTQAGKAMRARLLESTCKVPANAPLLNVILEFKSLYQKEDNRNAALSYSKVAEAIQNLNFEVTAENAMGLSKGKTKVGGIGKSSAEKMFEFLSTGKIEKLEEKRANNAL